MSSHSSCLLSKHYYSISIAEFLIFCSHCSHPFNLDPPTSPSSGHRHHSFLPDSASTAAGTQHSGHHATATPHIHHTLTHTRAYATLHLCHSLATRLQFLFVLFSLF